MTPTPGIDTALAERTGPASENEVDNERVDRAGRLFQNDSSAAQQLSDLTPSDVIDIARGSLTEDQPAGRLRRLIRRILLAMSGPYGSTVLSTGILGTALHLQNLSGGWLIAAMVAYALIRTGYGQARGTDPVANRFHMNKSLKRLAGDEAMITVLFLATCFLMTWPIPVGLALGFAGVNLVSQIFLMRSVRRVIKMLAENDRKAGRSNTMTHKALIIGTGDGARRIADLIAESPEMDLQVVGFLDFHRRGYWRYRDIPLIGHPDTLEGIVANSQIDALFWAVEPEDVPGSWKLMDTADRMGIRTFVVPNLYPPRVGRVRSTEVVGLPAMVYRSEAENALPQFGKKLVDWVGAVAGIIISAPIMLLIAAVIKLDSKGPVLFRQTRLGVNGRPFKMLKFRTMCSDAEVKKQNLMERNEMSGPVFKIKEDPRVTAVGRFLRKFSLDELPQFFNVLRGDMSLVGPRPPLPQEVSRFEPWQHRKLSVRPGLTCLWQVNGRNSIDFEDWIKLDLQYIDNWSLWLDAKIIVKTIPAVLKGSGQ